MENNNQIISQENKSIVNQNSAVLQMVEEQRSLFKLADFYSKSDLIPKEFQNKPANIVIALDMANRTGFAPMSVMQNLDIIYGRPAWRSQFVIACINQSRRYKSPLRFQYNNDRTSCYAYATGQDDKEVRGITITMEMANAEGWTTKNGSKWKTMPELMLQYRAASFFGKAYCPDLLMGIYTVDEVEEIGEAKPITVNPVEEAQKVVEETNKEEKPVIDVQPKKEDLIQEPKQIKKETKKKLEPIPEKSEKVEQEEITLTDEDESDLPW